MALRSAARILVVTLGVAALAAAGQLGVAYGLGIVRLTRVLDVTTRDQWTAQLAWVAWLAMSAAVIGAVAGVRLVPGSRYGRPAYGVGTMIAMALAAGAGAALMIPLTMQPARTAQIAGVHPVLVIGICAALGALAGVLAAVAALMQPVARWNLIAVGAGVWAIALLSVAPSLAPGDPLPAVRLGVFDAGYLSPAVTQRTALFTMPALALVAGALFGWLARRQGRSTLTVALAGLAGPALLTLAYLIAGPGDGAAHYQVVPYWAAMIATGAGLLGSVLAAVVRRGGDGDADADATPRAEPERTHPAGTDPAEGPAAARPHPPEPTVSGPATYGWTPDGIYRTSQTGSGVSTTSPSP
jgi:hypothetical protein